jgi:hypothetical protein
MSLFSIFFLVFLPWVKIKGKDIMKTHGGLTEYAVRTMKHDNRSTSGEQKSEPNGVGEKIGGQWAGLPVRKVCRGEERDRRKWDGCGFQAQYHLPVIK